MDTMTHETLITDLQLKSAYDHPVASLSLRETHISWVFLTGEYVYKIKKPVDFGFLDFSTLEKRKLYCEEEVRLNRRLAPSLYIGVVPICGTSSARINGPGPVIEYAVKMRQFDTNEEFDELLARNELTNKHIDETARVLAGFHANAEVADKHSPFGTPLSIAQPVEENFEQIKLLGEHWLDQHQLTGPLTSLHQWTCQQKVTLEAFLQERKTTGFIRECHGDLHLRNIVMCDDQVTPFDGIEFNDNLRWIDVMSELAFLLMDIDDHDRRDLSRRLLNHYLQFTGDYAGLMVLRYYQVYRAMVRAKVAGLQQLQTDDEDVHLSQEIENYLTLAVSYTRTSFPKLIITHGLSGSGKTYVSQKLLEHADIIRIRSDVERKRVFGLEETTRDESGIDQGIYSPDASLKTYQHLLELCKAILHAGFSVIVDAAFLEERQRRPFLIYARDQGIPFRILHCQSGEGIQRQRLEERERQNRDASDAGTTVLDYQIASYQPPGNSENEVTLTIDTSQEPDIRQITTWLDERHI